MQLKNKWRRVRMSFQKLKPATFQDLRLVPIFLSALSFSSLLPFLLWLLFLARLHNCIFLEPSILSKSSENFPKFSIFYAHIFVSSPAHGETNINNTKKRIKKNFGGGGFFWSCKQRPKKKN